MNNEIKKNRKRMRTLPNNSKKLRLPKGSRAALAAGTVTLAIMLASCGENGTGQQTSSTKPGQTTSTGRPINTTVSSVTTAPALSGTYSDVRYEDIPFDIVYVDDPDMYEDEEKVLEEGSVGKAEITEHKLYLNGKLQNVWTDSKVATEPRNRVISRGTKPILTTEENTVTETLEKYSTIYEECDTMEVGTTKLKTEGKNSVATRTYRYTYTKGELTSKELVSEYVSERVDEVILVGTKKVQQTFGMPFIDAAHGGVDYKLTQSYGGSNNHLGLDFAVYYGDPIVAVMDGTVIEAYDEGYFSKNNILWTYGTYIVIQHDGYRTYYAHLRTRNVSVGDKVKKGDIIGTSGNTGRINTTLTGPYAGTHLHFEIRKYYPAKKAYHTVDPKLYLPWWN